MRSILLALFAVVLTASVAKADTTVQFTTGVENREPLDTITEVVKSDSETQRIVFYSVIRDKEGEKVFHVWKNGDNEIYRHTINVGSQRWRVWSSVMVDHYETGDVATVEVLAENGEVLARAEIDVK